MASARQDFDRFVRWLYQADPQVSSDVRRLGSLCLANFDALARTSRNRSQRSIYLADLMRQQLGQTADEAPAIEANVEEGEWPWSRLHSLTLGPFRGFRTPEPFDLDKQITLLYGPNGSGKTSLCEALEYALLGDVEEAGTKRIAARTYLANLHAGRFAPPVLRATDNRGRQLDVVPTPDTFRFCFVEKNRIDSFSRIAARPNAQRVELIATLFGMDQFSDFVSHFNESMDIQLVLTADKRTTLETRRAELLTDQKTVEGQPEANQALVDEESALAVSYAPETSYANLKTLIGSEVTPGRLQELDAILEAVPPAIIGASGLVLKETYDRAEANKNILNGIVADLKAQNDQVSFKGLYEAVLALQAPVGDRCPACDTPLVGQICVANDPYEKATAGLQQLEALAVLQESQKTAEAEVNRVSRELRQIFKNLESFLGAEPITPVGLFLAGLPAEPAGFWWEAVAPNNPDNNPTLAHLVEVADRIAEQDAATSQSQRERQQLINERRKLGEFQLKAQAQDQKRQQFQESIDAAIGRIQAFDETNAVLIGEVAQEQLDIARDTKLKVAYDLFLEAIKSYRNQLPGQLMAGLNVLAMTLYNSFNRNDLEADKLAALHLPLTGEGKIEISFRGHPERRVDALHVLSEGHVRCLGLAILLAKAKSIECPLIVFDDAINAIDHDHRGGIRETIFENDTFADTQLIVTCHSNEFIKDIQQHLPARRRNNSRVYLLRHHDGNHQPRVRGNISSANYIAKARAGLEALNDRDALAASRQALEMLSEKVWKWLSSYDLGVLTLQISASGADPQLRMLCDSILRKLRDAATFNHANKNLLIDAYGSILGIPDQNLVWTYLNKGTHEEENRDDFDGDFVETVVSTLEALDALDLRPRR
ncbi:AAA family ATPase [Citrobacter freundii]|nr:AAA family ATPase [Citrobacter freundii]EJB8560514.1 AAA family ATPase [Citrobacter freundii]